VNKEDGAAATQRNLEEALSGAITFRPMEVHADGVSEFVRQGKVLEWACSTFGEILSSNSYLASSGY
jgi:hypothetical protein